MAKRRTNLEWQSLFEQYESSSVTQRAFCEEHGLSSFHIAPCESQLAMWIIMSESSGENELEFSKLEAMNYLTFGKTIEI